MLTQNQIVMKRNLLLLVLLMVGISISAQKIPENFIKFKQKFNTNHQQLNKRDGMMKLDSMKMNINLSKEMQTYSISHYSYNGQGSLSEVVDLYYDFEFDTMVYDYKTVYRYDITGYNVIAEIEYQWMDAKGDWMVSDSAYYTYSDDLIVQEDYYWWDDFDQEWDHDYISMYYYNGDDLIDSVVATVWNGTDYENAYKDVYEFVGGQLSEYYYYEWDGSSWYADMYSTYTWDGDKLTELVEQSSMTDIKELVNEYKYTYSWLPNGNLDEEIDYEWDTDLSDWVESSKMDGVYDNTVNYEDLVLPFAYEAIEEGSPDMFFAHKVDTVFLYEPMVTKDWVDLGMMNFYYSTFVGVNDDPSTYSAAKVYPNPASNKINIESTGTAQIQLLDISGKLISNRKIQGNAQIDVSGLNTGIYFVKIINESGVESVSKFIKE
jgi:hypothetical protein